MSKRITKKERKKQSIGAGIMIAVLIGFAAFALFQSVAQQSEKTKIIVVNEKDAEKDTMQDSVSENINTRASKSVAKSEEKQGDAQENEEEKVEENERAIGGPDDMEIDGETYQNTENNISFVVPSGWTSNEASEDRIGLVPAGEDVSVSYEGDIVISIKQNPENLSLKEFYNGTNDISLFTDALGGSEPITVGEYDGFIFKEVEGYVPSNVAVIKKDDVMVEVTDTGMRHAEDGLFEAVVYSVE